MSTCIKCNGTGKIVCKGDGYGDYVTHYEVPCECQTPKPESCPDCGSPVRRAGGCKQCINPSCGWAACG